MKVVITAGPTREFIDPVRFLSNPSTGRMGFEVAAEAARRGCESVLVAGPVTLKTPKGVRRIDVTSAREMLAAVKREIAAGGDIFIATAAVADWRPARTAAKKLKKSEMTGVLELKRNPDILKTVKDCRKIGFAAETGDPTREAARKCREKRLEFIVANDVTRAGAGFGTATNLVSFVFPDGTVRKFPLMTKRRVAAEIFKAIGVKCNG